MVVRWLGWEGGWTGGSKQRRQGTLKARNEHLCYVEEGWDEGKICLVRQKKKEEDEAKEEEKEKEKYEKRRRGRGWRRRTGRTRITMKRIRRLRIKTRVIGARTETRVGKD